MAPTVFGIDHVIVGVADLAAAASAWRRLGFALTPRGRHIGWGTANHCIMFGHDYVELLGIVDAARFTNNLDRFLAERGEGLLGLALATVDAARARRRLRRAGVATDPVRPLKRLLELPEGTVEPRFALVPLSAEATPGVTAFVCQHLTPELMRRPAWLAHANGARCILRLDVRVADLNGAAEAYGRVFGRDCVRADAGGVVVGAGPATLRLAPTGKADAPEGQGLVAMAVEVADADAAVRVLDRAGVPFSRPAPGRIAIAPAHATGVALELTSSGA